MRVSTHQTLNRTTLYETSVRPSESCDTWWKLGQTNLGMCKHLHVKHRIGRHSLNRILHCIVKPLHNCILQSFGPTHKQQVICINLVKHHQPNKRLDLGGTFRVPNGFVEAQKESWKLEVYLRNRKEDMQKNSPQKSKVQLSYHKWPRDIYN